MTYFIIWKETSLQLQKNPEYKKTDSIKSVHSSLKSVQSSLKFHSLWITLSDFVFKFIRFNGKNTVKYFAVIIIIEYVMNICLFLLK